MMNYVLWMKAKLDNFTHFQPMGGVDNPEFTYLFKVQCCHCGLMSKTEVCLSLKETSFLSKKEPNLQLVKRCNGCDRIGKIKMLAGKGFPLTLSYSLRGKPAPLMTFMCDGVEPSGPICRGLWEGVTMEGTPIKEIDLEKGRFTYPAEDGDQLVGISDVTFSFRAAR